MLVTNKVQMAHPTDPADDLFKAVGDLSGIQIFNNQILAAVYTRPEKTKGGIILTENTRGEDNYQSKVGLVVAMGPTAFEDSTGKWFKDVTVTRGEWVIFRPSDGFQISINGQLCRLLDDTVIRGKTSNPDSVW